MHSKFGVSRLDCWLDVGTYDWGAIGPGHYVNSATVIRPVFRHCAIGDTILGPVFKYYADGDIVIRPVSGHCASGAKVIGAGITAPVFATAQRAIGATGVTGKVVIGATGGKGQTRNRAYLGHGDCPHSAARNAVTVQVIHGIVVSVLVHLYAKVLD